MSGVFVPNVQSEIFFLVVFHCLTFSARLFMSTTVPAYRVPAQLSAFINVIDMCLSRDGLEEMFLDRFMELEKPRIQDSRLQSVSVC